MRGGEKRGNMMFGRNHFRIHRVMPDFMSGIHDL
jgi:hypothetical protein